MIPSTGTDPANLGKPWPLERREELQALLDMLSTLEGVNRGSGFLERVQTCITTAKALKTGDAARTRMSFTEFLKDKATGGT